MFFPGETDQLREEEEGEQPQSHGKGARVGGRDQRATWLEHLAPTLPCYIFGESWIQREGQPLPREDGAGGRIKDTFLEGLFEPGSEDRVGSGDPEAGTGPAHADRQRPVLPSGPRNSK